MAKQRKTAPDLGERQALTGISRCLQAMLQNKAIKQESRVVDKSHRPKALYHNSVAQKTENDSTLTTEFGQRTTKSSLLARSRSHMRI